MKKVLCIILMIVLAIPIACAESVDLSGLSFDELVALRDRINLAIWQADEWQEVTVPQGVWKVGEDIPVGHWSIRAADGVYTSVDYGDVLLENNSISWSSSIYIAEFLTSPTNQFYIENDDKITTDIDMKDGFYVVISSGSAVFSPYAGKPDLGFK